MRGQTISFGDGRVFTPKRHFVRFGKQSSAKTHPCLGDGDHPSSMYVLATFGMRLSVTLSGRLLQSVKLACDECLEHFVSAIGVRPGFEHPHVVTALKDRDLTLATGSAVGFAEFHLKCRQDVVI